MKNRKQMYCSEATADMSCPSCGGGHISSSIQEERFLYGLADKAIELRASIPIRKCADCGFEFTDEAAETSRHEAVCRHLGVLTPQEVLRIREMHGLSRAEFAKLTRIGEASLHRWENGLLIQNGAMDGYLRLLAFPDNIQRLRCGSLPLNPDVGSGEHPIAALSMHGQEPATQRDNIVPFRALRPVTEEQARVASTWQLRQRFA
jgi:putative zinc finger/helix-turn-helix YgiT family protein